MPTPEIIQRVREVHDELGKTTQDPGKPGIGEVRDSLGAVLKEPSHEPHYRTLAEKLFAYRTELELEHPMLAETVERLANELAAFGF